MDSPAKTAQQPFSILIAALGGEGGGVLAEWLVKCALRSGLPVQATSVPGVAQRTGATSYYIELMREPLPSGGPQPVFSLNPLPGQVDVLLASEAVEAGRMIERGYSTPRRTLLIASTHRVYTTAEKMHMADGRYDTRRVREAAATLARQAILLDMEAIARRHDTVLSAVMFGALAGTGSLPWSRDVCEQVIRDSGRGVGPSLAGFDDAAGQAQAVASQALAPEAGAGEASIAGDPDAIRVLQAAHLPDPLLVQWPRLLAGLPQPMQKVTAHGALRCRDYQDDEYARAYLDFIERLARAAGAATGSVTAGSTTSGALDEAARQLALWMCFEDVIRVAELKSRPARHRRVREEAQAGGDDIVRVTEYLKPGIEEVAAVMPQRLGTWLMRRATPDSWLRRAQVGLHVRSTSIWGHLLLRALARLRPWRRSSLRFHEEQQAIAAWLGAMEQALASAPAFALQLAGLPQVLKGYGDNQLRGRENYARLWAAHVVPAFAGGMEPEAAALQLKQALAATLSDPEGRLNATAAASGGAGPAAGAARADPSVPQTIRWIERPRHEHRSPTESA
jgi:indolepyruvate ferredoxin oxidoreductase, beta subunit